VKNATTPIAFTGITGGKYKVAVSDFQDRVFDHWSTGSTNRTLDVTLSANTTLTAFYKIDPSHLQQCTTVEVPVSGGSQVATYFMSPTYNGQCLADTSSFAISNPCTVTNGIATAGYCSVMEEGYNVKPDGPANLPSVEWFHFKGITLKPGEFLDMVDTTPFITTSGHVAMVLPCDSAGTPQVHLFEGIIDAGMATLEQPDIEFLQQLSSRGSAVGTYDGTCVYHFDIGASTNNPMGVTDFAIINTSGKPVTFGERNTATFSITTGFLDTDA